MKFKSMLATSALSSLTLGIAHNLTVAEINSTQIRTAADLAYAHRRLPFIGATFVPLDGRDAVIESLRQLKDRVQKAGKLSKAARSAVAHEIDATVIDVANQPEHMPKAQNGADEIPAGGFMAGDKPEAQRPHVQG